MQVSNTVAILIVALVLLGLFILNGCKLGRSGDQKKENFKRTCMRASDNCKFVRSPVDYAYGDDTDIPHKKGMEYPHFLGNEKDQRQPLDHGHVNLIKDEGLLWNPDKLWVQYEHDYKGCGNGETYIVNDDKTRWALKEVGDVWAARILEAQHLPEHGPLTNNPAITDLEMAKPDQYEPLYGGYPFLNMMLGR